MRPRAPEWLAVPGLALVAAIVWVHPSVRPVQPLEPREELLARRRCQVDPERVIDPQHWAVDGCSYLVGGRECIRNQLVPITLWWEGDATAMAPTLCVDDRPLSAEQVTVDADDQGAAFVVDPLVFGRLRLVLPDGEYFELGLSAESWALTFARRVLKEQREPSKRRALLAQLRSVAGPVDAHLLDGFDNKIAVVMGDEFAKLDGPWVLEQAPPEIRDERYLVQAHVTAIHHAMAVKSDYSTALEHLRAAQAHPNALLARIDVDYYEGILEQSFGRHDESLASFDRASVLARRAGREPELGKILVQRAVSLARLGRFDEAEESCRDAERWTLASNGPIEDVRLNVSWVQVLHWEEDATAPDPTSTLRELVEYYEGAQDGLRSARARLNLAIAASQRGDLDVAAGALAAVDRRQLDSISQVYAELVAARVATANDELVAAREFLERARLFGELASDEDLLLRVHRARAELERKAGNLDTARREHAAAEALEDGLTMGVAAQDGRSTFATAHRHGRARYLDLLLSESEAEAALCVVLGARSRSLRSLARRAGVPDDPERRSRQRQLLAQRQQLVDALERRIEGSWALPADELAMVRERSARELVQVESLAVQAMELVERDPALWSCNVVRPQQADEALLTMHPGVDPTRWWIFFERAGRVEVSQLDVSTDADAATLERASNEAVEALSSAGRLDQLRILTVVPLGAFVSVDFHALAALNQPEAPRVRYGLGLGALSARAPPRAAAAVVVDPTGSLREPMEEAAEVRATFEKRGWTCDDAWRLDEHTPPALLHYAGHGHYSGLDGWGSYLQLPSGRMTIPQLIARQQAPQVVVLGACDAGASDIELIDGGMNLASAFLLAGAELVIAPRRAVDDREARALARALYRELPRRHGESAQLPLALVDALSRAQRVDSRFSQWRAWVR